jgi:positive phototaxis protein PixI
MASTEAIAPSLEQFLCFQLPSGVQGILPTQQLTEVLSISINQLVPIADVMPSVLGVCNWRGEVLWLVDLGQLVGLASLLNSDRHLEPLSVIIVHCRGQSLGLVVERVKDMIWVDLSQIQIVAAESFTPAITSCLRGQWTSSTGEVFHVLRGEPVFDFLH